MAQVPHRPLHAPPPSIRRVSCPGYGSVASRLPRNKPSARTGWSGRSRCFLRIERTTMPDSTPTYSGERVPRAGPSSPRADHLYGRTGSSSPSRRHLLPAYLPMLLSTCVARGHPTVPSSRILPASSCNVSMHTGYASIAFSTSLSMSLTCSKPGPPRTKLPGYTHEAYCIRFDP